MKTKFLQTTVLSLFLLALAAGFAAAGPASPETGTIFGRVTDKNENPLPGASVSLVGSSLMGMRGHVTSAMGQFFFPILSPGLYEIRVEMPGFKIQVQRGLAVRSGQTTQISVRLEETAIDEEVTVPAGDQALDTRAMKTSGVIDARMLASLPLARDISALWPLIPGAVADIVHDQRLVSIGGSASRSQIVMLEGMLMNDPVTGLPLGNINYDIFDDVLYVTAGQPASIGASDGTYLQIATKGTGNSFSGGFSFHTTGAGLAQDIDPASAPSYRIRPPERFESYRDLSFSLGGSLMDDRAWIYLSGRRLTAQITNPFAPESRMAALGFFDSSHYDVDRREWMGFARLSIQATKEIKYSGLIHYNNISEPYDAASVAADADAGRVPIRSPENILATTHNFSVLINQNTYADIHGSLVAHNFTLSARKADQTASFDDAQKVWWGAPAYESAQKSQRLMASAAVTHFKEDLFGLDHEIKFGAEFDQAEAHQDWYRSNPYTTYWYDYSKRNPYYYDGLSLGRLEILAGSGGPGTWDIIDSTRRFSVFFQDTLTRKRLAINLGLRFEYGFLSHPDQSRALSFASFAPEFLNPEVLADDFLAAIDESFTTAGLLSPFSSVGVSYRKAVSFLTLSPRVGLVFDLTGDGRAALKLSYARYYEPMWISGYDQAQFLEPQSASFIWRDFDANGLMDLPGTDEYALTSYRSQDPALTYYEGLKPPTVDELAAGLEYEAAKDLRLSFDLTVRKTKNIVEDIDSVNGYDPTATDSIGKIWLPMSVADPGRDGRIGTSDDKVLTVYGLRADRPAPVWVAANPPEAVRNFWSAALTLDKRMSNNWALRGSVVYSSYRGTADFAAAGRMNRTYQYNDPNSLTNTDGPLAFDRPLQIRIAGTYLLPFQISFGAFFQYSSGVPWARTLSRVYFPAGYMGYGTRDPYVSVYAQPWGSERSPAYSNLDLHLEKSLVLKNNARLSLIVDVFNAGGRRALTPDEDPAGTIDMRKTPATYTTASTYGRLMNLYGVRQFRIGAKLGF
jgi:hypothetical protein